MRTVSWWLRLSVSVGFSVVGCGDDPAGAAVVGKPVDVTDGPGAVDTIVRMDVDPRPDLTPGAGLDSRGIDPDTFGTDMGSSCGSNSDCESGFCVHGQNGDVCTTTCVSSCPEGWACRQPSVGGDDVTFICLPRHVTLCRPCVDSATCATGGTQDKAYCADLGAEGQYCATPCDGSTPCPAGYSCKAPVGKVDSYCLPDSGKCDCDAVATAQGMHTICSISNDAGTCPGTRTCGLAGLGTCEGQTPKAEACNDLDDDCDGQTDEGFPTKGKPCDGDDVDECADGVVLCGANGPECQDDAASTNEACDNGKDDDCDGETDEGCCNTPGSPCCADSQCSGTSTTGVSGAAIFVHPNGKYVFGSTRVYNSIAVFSVNATDEKLTLIANAPTGANRPRSFGIDPEGKLLFAANQDSSQIVGFKVDGATGVLTSLGKTVDVPSPAFVGLVRMTQ